MILILLFNKLKSFLLIFVNIFNRALCCFRRRRRSFSDNIQLTHVGIVPNDDRNSDGCDFQNWTDWEDSNRPKTIQDHIDLYRKQKTAAKQDMDQLTPEQQLNFFDDMAPQITRQTKILINSEGSENAKSSNRLNFNGDEISLIPTSELGEWEESAGWEGETLDWVAQEALREKKKQERERRAWEQQQKRQERMNKSLGSRIST